MHPFIDTHSHILPGIDDGLNHLAETLETITELKKLGFGTIFCTPHQKEGTLNPQLQSVKTVFEAVQEEAEPAIRLFSAAENFFDPQFYSRVHSRTVPSYGGSEWFLFELPPYAPVAKFEESVFQMTMAGYRPVLAHIERYEWLPVKTLKKLRKSLSYQVNITSFVEKISSRERFKLVNRFMEKGLIDLLATDLHNKEIIPRIEEGMNFVDKHYGRERLEQLLIKNPRKIVKVAKRGEGPTP